MSNKNQRVKGKKKPFLIINFFDFILVFTACLVVTISNNALITACANTSVRPSSNSPTRISSNSPLGINLNGIDDWTTEWPFVDAFKISRPWISQHKDSAWGQGGPLHLTPSGGIASLDQDQYADTVMFDDGAGHYPGGQYVLLYNGQGTINFLFNSASVVSQKPGRMVLNVVPQASGIFMRLLATDPNNPVRNIRLIMPGFENTYKTQPFHPLFLQRLSKFKTIRFMDWMKTNNSTISKWTERPTLNSVTFADKGVALETMINLANTLHANPWFNIPHLATDDYVSKFAAMVRDRLDPSLKAHIEYSNEVWNGGFSQANYAQQKGLALGLDQNGFTAGLRYYSQRAVEVFKIWSQVFGGKGRLVRVLASQAVNPWTGQQVMTWKSAYNYADAYAIAPYFSGNNLTDPAQVDTTLQMSEDQIIDNILNQIDNGIKQYVTDNYTQANQYGLKLFAYEGGAGLESSGMPADKEPQVTALFEAVNRNPRMRDVYAKYLNMWQASGGKLLNQFVDVSKFSKYGSWGALEYQDQDPNTSPKYLGLMDFIARKPSVVRINHPSSRPGR